MRANQPVIAPSRMSQGFDPRNLVLPVVVFAIAEVLALAYVPADSFSLAAPHDVAVELVRHLADGTLMLATAQTLGAALSGLGLGGGLGLVFGVVLGLSPAADRLMSVTVETLRPIPPAALIPLSLLVYGFGLRMELAIIAFTTMWPVLVLTRAAIRETEPGLIEVAHVLRLSAWRTATRIVLPGAVPRIFVAFRLAAAISLVVAVTVEVVANPRGLGYGMMLAAQSLHPAISFAFLVWIAIVGWCFNWSLVWLERQFFARRGAE